MDNATGTGFVHIAPGHGLDDYHLGTQHGLPIYSPVDDDGKFAYTNDLPQEQQMPAEMIGKSILEKHGKSDANEAVLHELRARKALLHQENYHHSYPHCWRSKTPIIFRAMDQWFIEIDHAKFRERALEEINRVNWVPDWGKSRIEAAVKGRPDWCISRQRTWGVPIPAFYDAQGNPILDAQIVRNAAALVEQHGSNVWFEKSAAELWAALKPADWKGPEPAAKSNDTLDVWIDSGSSSRAVHRAPPGTPRAPGSNALPVASDMYLEGSDQHRGWFQSSLLLSLAGNGAAPFKTVLTHGFMVDADREKISKSKQGQGGYEKPQTSEAYVKKWGADIVRLWVASQDFRNDIIVSEERISKVAETYRVLRNALRYQLSNLYDFDPAKHAVPDDKLTGLDRWILGEFSQLEQDVIAAYDQFEFHVVYQKVSQFVAVELSAIYHDVVKDRLYTDPANSAAAPLDPDRAAPDGRRPVQDAGADPGLHGGRGVGVCAGQDGRLGPPAHLAAAGLRAARGRSRPRGRRCSSCASWRCRSWRRPVRPKHIGKALEAKLTFAGSSPALTAAQAHQEALRELLNVSQLEITAGGRSSPHDFRQQGRRREMRALLALGDGRRRSGRASHDLRPVREGGAGKHTRLTRLSTASNCLTRHTRLGNGLGRG